MIAVRDYKWTYEHGIVYMYWSQKFEYLTQRKNSWRVATKGTLLYACESRTNSVWRRIAQPQYSIVQEWDIPTITHISDCPHISAQSYLRASLWIICIQCSHLSRTVKVLYQTSQMRVMLWSYTVFIYPNAVFRMGITFIGYAYFYLILSASSLMPYMRKV